MKRGVNVFLILILASTLVACSKDDKRESIRGRSGRTVRDTTTTTTPRNIDQTYQSASTGRISTDQNHLDAFVTAQGEPSQVIGLIGTSGTGVYFNGQADAAGDSIPYATLAIEVVDSWYKDKQVDSPFRISSLKFLRGSITGDTSSASTNNKVYLEFADEYQRVVLEGRIAGDNFEGTIFFENYLHFNNETPFAGQLGQFTIPVCSYFRCQ